MNDLFRLYNDVFSKLPVSLVGYDDINEKINSFFYKLTSDSYFREFDNITFFSYSLSKLVNAKKWETDSLSHEFFFDAFKKRNSLLTLSFYNYIKKKYDLPNTITSLSQLFAKNVSFRVSCTDTDKWNFYYDQGRSILSFEIPNCIIKRDNYCNVENRFFDELTKRNKLDSYFLNQNKSLYKTVNINEIEKEIKAEHERFFNEGFNSEKIGNFKKLEDNTLFKELKTELDYFSLLNKDLFVESTEEKKEERIKSWISQLISIAYLAGNYDCWIEYMPAVVGVFELKNENGQVYKTENRNLGSFIIGYSKVKEISLDDRAVFRLISERISLAVGGEHFRQLILETEKQATRAAISQVMARNMSHNIGSHVLSKMVSIDAAKDKFPYNNQYNSTVEHIYNSIKPSTVDKKDFDLSNFNSYLRTRMDFLADIATGEPAMETSRLLVRDIIGEMDKNRILLNNISGVDDFKFTIEVKDCRECEENCNERKCICNEENKKDIPVSIPNGIMGYHALFVIIENIIRNTAKHQNTSTLSPSKDKVFTLEIRNSMFDKTLLEAWIYDDVLKTGTKTLSDDDKKYYKEKTRKEYGNCETKLETELDWLIFQQNSRLNDSVINPESSRLREGAWGLIEMDASAAYLRKLAPEKIDEEIYNIDLINDESRYNPNGNEINVLKAVNKNGHLGYRFHLMKPKELLVIDESGEIYKKLKEDKVDNKFKLDLLLENGIWVKQSTNPNAVDYFDINSVYAHPFMLVIAGKDFVEEKYLYVDGDKNKLFRGNLPNRIIACTIKRPKHKSSWITYIDCKNELMNILQSADKFLRDIPQCESDIQKDILMDLVWKVWLMNKMDFHNAGIRNEENAFEKKINGVLPYLKNSKKNQLSLFRLHHPKKSTLKSGRNSDFILGYPSSVKEFVVNSILTVDETTERFNKNIDKINAAILADSIFNKILIFDERIQSSWETKYPDIDMIKLLFFNKATMFCPSKNCINLNALNYSTDYEKKILDIIDLVSKAKKICGVDFIVIHLGVIEKILAIGKKSKNEKDVREFILKLQNCLCSKTRIIITSGRGKPDNLPKEVPFVSFSTLSQFTIETPFKPFLNQTVQSARIFKNS